MEKNSWNEPLTVEQAFEKTDANDSVGYEWYAVKSKCGNILEIGGTSKQIKVEVITVVDNEIVALSNGMVQDNFSISIEYHDMYQVIETLNHRSEIKMFKTIQDFKDYLNTEVGLNQKVPSFEPVYKTVVAGYQFKEIK